MSESFMVNGNDFVQVKNNSPLIPERRNNNLTSIWDILFGDLPKEWIGFKPALGYYVYPCYACRHMFSSLSSLQDHVNRRIIVLEYNCPNCPNETLTFYNRCTLLLHSRSHFSDEVGQVNLSAIKTFTLPFDLAGFLPLPDIPRIYDQEEVPSNEKNFYNVQFYVPDTHNKGMPVAVLKPNNFIYKDLKYNLVLKQICRKIPKCEFITLEEQLRLKEMSSMEDESENLQEPDIKVELFDYIDQLTLPIISKVESLHDPTSNAFRCLECDSVQNRMDEHYLGANKPTDFRLTCPTCKFVAPTRCYYKAHIRIHNSEPPHVCPDCGNVFNDWRLLRTHLEEICYHFAKNVKYRCSGKRCGKLFASETNLILHYKHHFKESHSCTVCSEVYFTKRASEDHKLFHSGNCSFVTRYECCNCKDLKSLTETEYKEHLTFHIGNTPGVYVYMCKHCRNYFRTITTYATHLLKCPTKQYHETGTIGECESCKVKILCESRKTFGNCWRNRKTKIFPVTKKYFCILCNDQIPLEMKLSHMKTCRYAHPIVWVSRVNDHYLNESYGSSSDTSSSRESRKSLRLSESPKSEEIGKKKQKKCVPFTRSRKQITLDPTADKPVEFDGTYYCKLCDYQHAVRTEFHDHIRTHRDISTAYQCMECGECFVVKPSLIKHLLHFHNISDYKTYLLENDCYDIEAVKELESVMRLAPGESKGPIKENQCRVCLEQFDDVSTLNKHFRVHGMAFLLKNTK